VNAFEFNKSIREIFSIVPKSNQRNKENSVEGKEKHANSEFFSPN
jgi:hypothetical protein